MTYTPCRIYVLMLTIFVTLGQALEDWSESNTCSIVDYGLLSDVIKPEDVVFE
jgi:hypothetical protein